MQLPWELVAQRFLPVLRAATVRALIEEHHKKQAEVAQAMGLTQAAVSHYLHEARGADADVLRLFPELREDARELARAIASGASEPEQAIRLDRVCTKVMRDARFCQLHRALEGLPECNICFDAPGLPSASAAVPNPGEHA